jgi:hypothetical protein
MCVAVDADTSHVHNPRLNEHVEERNGRTEGNVVAEADSKSMSPRMLELILGYAAKTKLKRPRARDARGRFVSSR